MNASALLAFALYLCLAVPANAADFKDDLKRTLKENPQILLDFLHEHKVEVFEIVDQGIKAKREQDRKKRREAEQANPLKPALDPSRVLTGNPQAPVAVVEYSDFLCSYCSRGAKLMDDLIKANPDKIALTFKHFAAGEASRQAALYYEACLLQGKEIAKKYHDLAFASQDEIAKGKEETLRKLAIQAGADGKRLALDVKRKDLEERLAEDLKEAQAFDFTGTPAYVVGGFSVRGAQPMPEFEEVLGLALARGKAGTSAGAILGGKAPDCADCQK